MNVVNGVWLWWPVIYVQLCLQQFLQQHRHYQSNVQIFKLQPNKPNKELAELVMFLAQVLCDWWICVVFGVYRAVLNKSTSPDLD